MRRKPTFRHIIPELLTLLLPACLCNYTAMDTGGSSGTEISDVGGSIIDEYGNAIGGAQVRLRPHDYLADSAADTAYTVRHTIRDTISGTDGSFVFLSVLSNDYVIESTLEESLGVSIELSVNGEQPDTTLPPLTAKPMAWLTGNAQAYDSQDPTITVQLFGSDRSTGIDSFGNFSLRVPYGRQQIHIAAYTNYPTPTEEFSYRNISLQVTAGEEQEVGHIPLRHEPTPPCSTGACDSQTVRSILDRNSYRDLPLDSVTKTENGRIVSLTLRGFRLSDWYTFEINRLQALRILDLGKTELSGMFRDIGTMTELEKVILDHNYLSELSPSIGYCKKLRVLNLLGNRLHRLPSSIINCSELNELDVADNQLCSVNDTSLLEWLDLSDPDWRENQHCR